MKNTMSRILIESTVKRTIKSIRNDPKRSIRNIIDMALQFSDGRFQQQFFTAAQTLLKNENSAYYSLVSDTVLNVDENRLLTFGMNLGYNSCTFGARKIRENEQILNCNIPWTICLQTDEQSVEKYAQQIHQRISEGEELGIYTWMLFAQSGPEKLLPLLHKHSNCAFILFCRSEDLSTAFTEQAAELYNLMLVVPYEEENTILCTQMQEMGLLYSFYSLYSQKDTEDIVNGNLFCGAQQLHPVFHALLPKPDCPQYISNLIHQMVARTREEQMYSLIPWELNGDNQMIDRIISDDVCDLFFDIEGSLYHYMGEYKRESCNLFEQDLTAIVKMACPKNKEILQ